MLFRLVGACVRNGRRGPVAVGLVGLAVAGAIAVPFRPAAAADPTDPAATLAAAPTAEPVLAASAGVPLVGPHPVVVTASTLDASNFVFRGTTSVRTPAGRLTVLVFHADRIVARNYTLRSANTSLRGNVAISGADIYATRLSGNIAVPFLHLPLAPVTLTPDLVPAWLPVDIALPMLASTDVTVEQAYLRADELDAPGSVVG